MNAVQTTIRNKALLVNVITHQWTGRKRDKSTSSQVCTLKKAKQDAGSWWTYIVPQRALNPIGAARVKVIQIHHLYTLPWTDGGFRILPSKMFAKYSEELRKAIDEHNEAVRNCLADYDLWISEAASRLGDLYDPSMIPDKSELFDKFRIETEMMPLPDSNDFRIEGLNGDMEAIAKQIEMTSTNRMKKATKELTERFGELVGKIESTMKDKKKIFRDSLIKNLAVFCEDLKGLNVMEDQTLESIRNEAVQKLANLKPIDLRESNKDRKRAHKDAKAILEKLEAYAQ